MESSVLGAVVMPVREDVEQAWRDISREVSIQVLSGPQVETFEGWMSSQEAYYRQEWYQQTWWRRLCWRLCVPLAGWQVYVEACMRREGLW